MGAIPYKFSPFWHHVGGALDDFYSGLHRLGMNC
jgi:hypothetical protein